MKSNSLLKLTFFLFLITSTLLYSYHVRRKFVVLEGHENTPILKSIPEIKFLDSFNNADFSFDLNSQKPIGSVVHFWGTWCGPCETELPSFISLANEFEESNLKFYLIAVNDEKLKLKKFLKRFKTFPKNIQIVLDNSGQAMASFGVVKVPETFVFNESGQTLKKFSGPQEWNFPYYHTLLKDILILN